MYSLHNARTVYIIKYEAENRLRNSANFIVRSLILFSKCLSMVADYVIVVADQG